MPLPPTPINYLDQDGVEKTAVVKGAEKPSGYKPSTDYHPTMEVVKCASCNSVGVAEFVNGFNLREGDALMDGKPIRGTCFRCRKTTELIPLKNLVKQDEAGIRHLYRIRQTLEEMAKRGQSLGPSGMIYPIEKLREYEQRGNA